MRLSRPVAAIAASALVMSGLAVLAPSAAHAADLNTAPYRSISGPITGLENVKGIARDAAGNLYVGDYHDNAIRVFAPNATGNAAPIRTIVGPATGINYPDALEVDSAGLLYTASFENNTVTIHAAGANGNAAPLRTIGGSDTRLDGPGALALGRDGQIYVANYDGASIAVFPKNANGNVAPTRFISGGSHTSLASTEGLVVDDRGQIYVSNSLTNGSVAVFSATANGDVSPTRVISGPSTGLTSPTGLELDSSNNLYVGTLDDSVVVFASGAQGDAKPISRLIGSSTRIDDPWEIALDADRNLYLTNSGGPHRVTAYRPLVPFAKPSAARSVTVSGAAKAKQRKVRWSAPTADGGAPVSYRVVVKQGSKVKLDRTLGSSVRSLTVTRKNLGSGKHTVAVIATNRAGAASAVRARFSVSKIKPGAVRGLKVKGKTKASKRKVAWVKPAWDGGAKVTSYRVIVKKGKTVLVAETVKASKRSLTVRKSALGKGKHTVLVRAKNSKGYGASAKATFRVKK